MSKEKTDYTLIKKGIKIESQKRDRVEILSNKKEYYLGELFKEKILSKMTNEKIESETLQETELLACKKDSEIISEMDIKEINPDQIAERIIQLGKITKWIIIGYCDSLVVYANPSVAGRVSVGAYEHAGWDGGDRLLSSDSTLELCNSEMDLDPLTPSKTIEQILVEILAKMHTVETIREGRHIVKDYLLKEWGE